MAGMAAARTSISWGKFSGQEFLSFGPHFGHQYSHVWIDFRGIQDEFMRAKGIDYFENSRRATYAQRSYAIGQSAAMARLRQRDMGSDARRTGRPTRCRSSTTRSAAFSPTRRGRRRAPQIVDDGTIAPTAAVASIAFAPEIVIPTIRAFRARFGENLYQRYGFLDAVNQSFTFSDVPLRHGTIVDGVGWIAGDYLGIDQGPIVAMIENYRSEVIWRTMQRNPHIRRGLSAPASPAAGCREPLRRQSRPMLNADARVP